MSQKIRQFAVLALFVATVLTNGCATSAPEIAEVGSTTPDFELSPINSRTALSSDSLGGEVVVLNFWSTSCANCLKEIADLNRINEISSVRVIGIALDENSERVSSAIASCDINYEVVMGTPSVFEKFDGYAIPYTVVIDDEKIVRRMVSGVIEYDELLKAIEHLKPATTAMTSETDADSRS